MRHTTALKSLDHFIVKLLKKIRIQEIDNWEDKHSNSESCAPTFFFPQHLQRLLSMLQHCWVWCQVNISLVSWGQVSCLCPLPTSCAPSTYLLVGQCEKQKRPSCCASTAQRM